MGQYYIKTSLKSEMLRQPLKTAVICELHIPSVSNGWVLLSHPSHSNSLFKSWLWFCLLVT